MTFAINVQGGTGAGRKRAPAAAAKEWPCICIVGAASPSDTLIIRVQHGDNVLHARRKTNPGYLNRCPDCGEPRPGSGYHRGTHR